MAGSKTNLDPNQTVFDVADFLARHARVPSLDGWRALSIVLVVGSHVQLMSGFAGAERRISSFGEYGVDVFFVLSGFLITYLLLIEKRRFGTISIKNFYLRRAYRILPIYLVFMSFVFVITALSALSISGLQWAQLITFTANYQIGEKFPFSVGHIWSLSVEEQFYLLWPALLLFTLSRRRPVLWTLIGIGFFIALPAVARVAGYFGIGGVFTGYYSFFTRCDSIAWGAVAAALCVFKGGWVDRVTTRYSPILSCAALIVITTVVICFNELLLGPVMLPFGRTMFGMATATIIVVSIRHHDQPFFAWLNWKPVAFVGVLSYSLYIWQQLFTSPAEVYGLESVPWFLTPELFLFPLFALAYAMHLAVERPFLSLKNRRFKKVGDNDLFRDNAGRSGMSGPDTLTDDPDAIYDRQ